MFCALLRSRYQVSVYRTNGPLVLISSLNIDCGYSLIPPQRGGSNKGPQFMFLKYLIYFI